MLPRPHRHFVALAALIAAASFAPAPAQADPPGAQVPREVRVEAALVRASRGEPHVDPALKGFSADLSALPFNHFKRLDGGSWTAAQGGRAGGTLGEVRVAITVEAVADSGATLVVDLFRGDRRVTHTTVQRPWGRAHVFTVGSDAQGTLVVPVRVMR